MKRAFDTVMGFICLCLAIAGCEPVDIPNYDIFTGWEVKNAS